MAGKCWNCNCKAHGIISEKTGNIFCEHCLTLIGWQMRIPKKVYMKSMFRHFMEVWKAHRENKAINI